MPKRIKTELICMNCGEIVSILRSSSRVKTLLKVTDMYCHCCEMETKFIEIIDKDMCYLKLLNKKKLEPLEKYTLQLLESKVEKREKPNEKRFMGIRKRKI